MKLQLYLLIGMFGYLSKCEDIIKPTNYTLSYLNSIMRSDTSCQSDSDCPEYSKCVKYQEGVNTLSLCTYGSFLCPKMANGYFLPENNENTCVYVNTDIYNIDLERFNNTLDTTKPILKICPPFNPRGDLQYYGPDKERKYDTAIDCYTDKCSNDNDCFSGMCQNGICINNIKIDYYIYRCTGVYFQNFTSVKCAKYNGMECSSNEDCYTGVCNKGYCADVFSGGRISFSIEPKKQIIFILLGFLLLLL